MILVHQQQAHSFCLHEAEAIARGKVIKWTVGHEIKKNWEYICPKAERKAIEHVLKLRDDQ